MQQPVSSSLQLVEHDTPCPDLLTMDIQLDSLESPRASGFDVFCSLSTGRYWSTLAGGQVQVAIAKAHLTLDLQNATFNPTQDTEWVDHAVSVQYVPNSMPHVDLAPLNGSILDIDVKKLKLGTLHLSDAPSAAVFTVAIAPRDIRIIDAVGLWRHDITPNKHGIIERKLAQSVFATALSPYLSRAQFCHRCPAPYVPSEQEIPLPDDETLRQIITAVIEAPTSSILDLAQRAELLPETDLAGAQFRGASLSGLDLSTIDLSCANLRGVDLTDAELSETNLNHAKLGGADLSGADLGSANLQNADLHRASLALANLSGADLSGANLRQTNLSQTNLNGVHVEGAIFSHNTGLSDEVIRSLVAKGAIVEDE